MGRLFVRWLSVVVMLGVVAVASAQGPAFPPEHLAPVIKAQMKAAADLEQQGQFAGAYRLVSRLSFQVASALRGKKLPEKARTDLTALAADLKESASRLRKKAGIFSSQDPDLAVLDDLMKKLEKTAKAGEYQKAIRTAARLNSQLKMALSKKDLSPKLRAELTSRAAEVLKTYTQLRRKLGIFPTDEREVVRGRILRLTEAGLLIRTYEMKSMEFRFTAKSNWYRALVEVKKRGDGVAVTFGRDGEKLFVLGATNWEPKTAFERLASRTEALLRQAEESVWLRDKEIKKREQIFSACGKLKAAIQRSMKERKYGSFDGLKTEMDRLSKELRELSSARYARQRKTYTLESDSRKLVAEISKAALDEKRKELILKLRSVLAELFGLQADMKRLKLKRLEREVSRLKEILKVRDANKGEIIERRVQELLNPTIEGSRTLRWNTSR